MTGIDLTLRDKGSLVQGLWDAVNRGTGSLANVAPLVRRVLETGAWRERIQDGEKLTNQTFLEFVTAHPLKGCGWEPEQVEALIKDEPDTLVLWHDATKGQHGGDRTASKNDNITLEPKTGTSRAYTLARLKRKRRDLFDDVKAGKLSANAAAIKAGFRKPSTPIVDLRRAWKRASEAEREQFRKDIT